MFVTLRNQLLKIFFLIICLASLALHLAQPINLTAVDIGRHIKNGELVLSGQWQVLYKNFYSYTYPDYPFINHHWFFGVIADVLFQISGFIGLSLFYILLLVAAFFLAFDSSRRYADFYLGIFACVAVLLLVSSRAEIRPEGFSVFFVALDFWLLQRFLQRTLESRTLWVVPLIQVIWVNIHIFFFLGPLLVALFLWQSQISADRISRAVLQRVLLVTILANLLNPSGIWGMLTPLNGFKKFGYDLAENQSVFFMIHRFPDVLTYKYYLFAAFLLMVGMLLALYREGMKVLPMVTLGVFITLAALKAVRLIMPFGFIFVPLMGYFYAPYIQKKSAKAVLLVCSMVGFVWSSLAAPVHPYLGLMPGVERSAAFYDTRGLQGPIFSNYDIGGYLIYHLSPKEKVFVDNRQEAFPVDFFRKVYVPMQENAGFWNQKSRQYGFNVIYFYRHDITPWGQQFLIDRVQDPLWAPVFVDDYTIIFARRGSVDQGVIDHFELPKAMFGVTRT